jgi:hypothetical protein
VNDTAPVSALRSDDEDPEWVWVEDRDCGVPVVPGVVRCSYPRCQEMSVLWIRRWTRDGKQRMYFYCEAHSYGRRVQSVVVTRVPAGSPAAERGYVEQCS